MHLDDVYVWTLELYLGTHFINVFLWTLTQLKPILIMQLTLLNITFKNSYF